MTIDDLLNALNQEPMTISFAEILAIIEAHYNVEPTAFRNGAINNAASENQGSAKVLGFACLVGLSKQSTLRLFSEHYQAVLSEPNGTSHQNIRQFMVHGWPGVQFERPAVTENNQTM